MNYREDPNPKILYGGKEVEVLTLHLNNGMMRIRHTNSEGKKKTWDVSNESFFDKYSIVEKNYDK